jgi:DNA invertase Pin-like site-specific DNA recombinase
MAGILGRLDAGDADTLIVQRLDRIGRRQSQVSTLVDHAADKGWSIVVLEPELDTRHPMARFIIQMIAAVAEQERELLVGRTTEGLAQARREGAVLGRRRMPREVAARIIAERDAGGSWSGIAAGLTADGVATSQGGQRWHASTVMRAYQQMPGHDLAAMKWAGRHNEDEESARLRIADRKRAAG